LPPACWTGTRAGSVSSRPRGSCPRRRPPWPTPPSAQRLRGHVQKPGLEPPVNQRPSTSGANQTPDRVSRHRERAEPR
jgi:hypothetical protein